MKKKTLFMAALAAALVLCAGIGGAWGYFTTSVSTGGQKAVHLAGRREFTEEFSDWTKTLTVTNDAASGGDIYVRARVFAPDVVYVGSDYLSRTGYELTLDISGQGWTPGQDGYWYYSDPVPPGGAAALLTVKIDGLPGMNSAGYAELRSGDSFEVTVVYESVPVTYGPDGTPVGAQSADWTRDLIVSRTEGGLTGE